jgi:hypothetical protein
VIDLVAACGAGQHDAAIPAGGHGESRLRIE